MVIYYIQSPRPPVPRFWAQITRSELASVGNDRMWVTQSLDHKMSTEHIYPVFERTLKSRLQISTLSIKIQHRSVATANL